MTTTRAIIFDLDDTLCDYAGARSRAFETISDQLRNHGLSPETFWTCYRERDHRLFSRMVDGSIAVEQYRTARFLEPLRELGVDEPGIAESLNALYMDICNRQVQLFDDASVTVLALRGRSLRVGLLTNGPADGQNDKLDCLGIRDWFDAIRISGEVGIGKPHAEAFRGMARALGVEPGACMMVGDSLSVDVEGAKNAGMRALLLERRAAGAGDGVITSLPQLLDLLGVSWT